MVFSNSHRIVQKPPPSNSRAFPSPPEIPYLLLACTPLAFTPWSLATTVAMEMPVWMSPVMDDMALHVWPLPPRAQRLRGCWGSGLCQRPVPAHGRAVLSVSTHPLTAFGLLPLWAAVSDAAVTMDAHVFV